MYCGWWTRIIPRSLGRYFYEILLRDIRLIKARSFVLDPRLVFVYHGQKFSFTGFSCAKEFLEIILQENQQEE